MGGLLRQPAAVLRLRPAARGERAAAAPTAGGARRHPHAGVYTLHTQRGEGLRGAAAAGGRPKRPAGGARGAVEARQPLAGARGAAAGAAQAAESLGRQGAAQVRRRLAGRRRRPMAIGSLRAAATGAQGAKAYVQQVWSELEGLENGVEVMVELIASQAFHLNCSQVIIS